MTDYFDSALAALAAPRQEMTPERIRTIRRKVASSTRAFEVDYWIPARTMEAYEQGRRRPDTATQALLTIIEHNAVAAKRALTGMPSWAF